MKTIVIYRSLSGFSKKYAEWIAQETKADLFDAKEVHTDLLKKYDCIVF
jgi:flavodoxin